MTVASPDSPRRSADHYSYSVYADPATAEAFDRARFSGPIGTLVAESQERVLVEFLGECGAVKVLDVGTGTGRAALALARAGAVVTGVDASAEMLEVARRRSAAEGLPIDLVRGDAHALAWPDRSFDAVVSLRVLMHTPDWRRSLAEMCRVARRQVIVDYPAMRSVAAIQSAGRYAVQRLGRRLEAYRVFRHGVMAAELARWGFAVTRVHRQFVLPIAFHKAIGSRRFTEVIEGLLAAVGLLALFGSPVTVAASRTDPHGDPESRSLLTKRRGGRDQRG